MAERIVVREARGGDEEALQRIARAAWSPKGSPASRPPADRPFLEPRRSRTTVLVAVADGATCGYVETGPPTDNDSSRHVRQLKGLDVDPDFRRQGIGARLLEAAIRKSELAGARRLTLRVLATNEPAVALYEEAGFVLEGRFEGEFELDGEPVDDLLMGLALPRPKQERAEGEDEDW